MIMANLKIHNQYQHFCGSFNKHFVDLRSHLHMIIKCPYCLQESSHFDMDMHIERMHHAKNSPKCLDCSGNLSSYGESANGAYIYSEMSEVL